jgi:hypothetical protein
MSHVAAPNASALPASRWPVWIGRTLSGLVVLFLVMDASMKIAALPIVSESAVMIGWTADPDFWRAMGLLLFAITVLYAWPRTAVLGAILLTGYLGGAVARMPDQRSALQPHIVRRLSGDRFMGRPVAARRTRPKPSASQLSKRRASLTRQLATIINHCVTEPPSRPRLT